MCFREMQCIEFSCGHQQPYTESKIDCGSNRCRYSDQHVKPCGGCPATCSQMLGRAQPKVGERRDSRCPHCARQT